MKPAIRDYENLIEKNPTINIISINVLKDGSIAYY